MGNLFTAKTLDFLFENRLQDSKDWFEAHKDTYRQLVLEPLQALVQELNPFMLQIDKHFVTEPRVDRTICRIRRDTRYSHDKSLYRDNMWIIYKRGKMHGTDLPGFYFELSGEGFFYGCGFYSASTSYMTELRDLALSGHQSFIKAKKALEQQDVFHLDGDLYKRSRFPDQPEHMRNWLDRRGICFNAESRDFDLLFSPDLSRKLMEDFQKIIPMYEFMCLVAEEQRRKEGPIT